MEKINMFYIFFKFVLSNFDKTNADGEKNDILNK